MKKSMYWVGLAAAAALLVSAQASATLIDFENAPSHGLSDNSQVTDQYKASDGVTFSNNARLEHIHNPSGDHNPQGFLNDQTGKYDDPRVPGLGTWFLRTKGSIGGRNGGIFLDISYDTAVNAASGQIWDIDGSNGGGSNSTEQWKVIAYAGTTQVDFALSPLGQHHGPNSLNGKPWTFNLSSATAFNEIKFQFVGGKTGAIGLAFDNFNTSSITPVPEPAVLGMFGLGTLLIGLFVGLRRRTGARP